MAALPVALFALLLAGCADSAREGRFAAAQPALAEYAARLPAFRAAIPEIVRSAEAAAARVLEKPDTLIDAPYNDQPSFSEELINRAGGLTNVYPTEARRELATDHDIVLYSCRSWEQEGDRVAGRLAEFRKNGWTTTLFASQAGRPKELDADYFIDNGAPDGSARRGRINLLANVTLGWMWCCEYTAALTRRGRFPGILISIAMPGAEAHDRPRQTATGRLRLEDCPTPVPAGRLSEAYLARVEKLVADLASPRIQNQLDHAADIIARRLAEGRTVGLSGVGHVIIAEATLDLKSPFVGFPAAHRARTAFKRNLQEGDLLVWIAYAGMNSKYDNYAQHIAERKLDLVTCYAPDPVWAKDAPPALAHIDQCWTLPDAEVDLPCFPNKMAPVSGLNSGLILRMLDDEVSARLAKFGGPPAAPRPATAPAAGPGPRPSTRPATQPATRKESR